MKLIKDLNKKLIDENFCLPMPGYLTNGEISELSDIGDISELIKHLTIKVMSLPLRIMQIISRYEHLAEFKRVLPFIQSALRCYYLGEYNAGQATLYLTVESILSQWNGGKFSKNNIINKWRKEWKKISKNSPSIYFAELLESYKDSCLKLIEIFFEDTSKRAGNFNRHLVCHFLHDFEYKESDMARTFLLLDILAELIYCQNRGYENVSRFTYLSSAIEQLPSDVNISRLKRYNDLQAEFMLCIQYSFAKDNFTKINKIVEK